ncbi:MAG TPA: hypothetical protein VF916_15625, partial [Ktedonobacterales bacterium]
SVSRGLRPPPARSPSPSRPCAFYAWIRSRTVWALQRRSPAIVVVRVPAQLRTIIWAWKTQSAGACRLLASWRTCRASSSSWAGQACSRFGMVLTSFVSNLSLHVSGHHCGTTH